MADSAARSPGSPRALHPDSAGSGRRHRRDALRQRLHDPALTGLLVIQCLIIFILAPLAETGHWSVRAALESLIIAFAALILVISRGPVTMGIAAFGIAAGVIGSGLQLWAPSSASLLLAHTGGLSALTLGIYIIGRAVFAPGAITTHRVLGAVALYLNLGLTFSTAYRLIWDFNPGSLGGVTGVSWQAYGSILYFSFSTLTSVGYGDIVPIHPFARALSNLEAIIGQLYPATLLARLVTLERERRRH